MARQIAATAELDRRPSRARRRRLGLLLPAGVAAERRPGVVAGGGARSSASGRMVLTYPDLPPTCSPAGRCEPRLHLPHVQRLHHGAPQRPGVGLLSRSTRSTRSGRSGCSWPAPRGRPGPVSARADGYVTRYRGPGPTTGPPATSTARSPTAWRPWWGWARRMTSPSTPPTSPGPVHPCPSRPTQWSCSSRRAATCFPSRTAAALQAFVEGGGGRCASTPPRP